MSSSGLNRASVTAANAHDNHQASNLLHGQETCFCGDGTYWGKEQHERLKVIAPKAKGFTDNRAFAMLATLNVSQWGRPLTGQVRPV